MNEYIKRRRLSLAHSDLIQEAKISDVAYEYGYLSIDGFTPASKGYFHYLPSEAKKTYSSKIIYANLFFIQVKGGKSMEYKIVNMPAFNFVGVSKRVPMQFEGVNNAIVELAQSISENQRN